MNYSLISFDIWDTVIRRDCHPEQIKLEMAAFVAALLQSRVSARRIYLKRLSIEQALGARAVMEGRAPDCDFEDVHRELLSWLVRRNCDAAMLKSVLEKEVELEIAHTYVDKAALRLLADAHSTSARVIFISDFYMPAQWLSRVLDANGVLALFDKGYVSIEYGKTKHCGTLFDEVRRLEAVPRGAAWRHYGDNGHSDVKQAMEHGIDGVLFVPEEEHALRGRKESLFLQTHGLKLLERAGLRIAARLSRP
jgi:predicted HAD superfamily hydrolase